MEWVEDCLESVCLVEGEVCVGVCILNRENDVVNEWERWSIGEEVVVGWFWMMVVCLNEVMVKVKMIVLRGFELRSRKEGFDE